MPDSQFTHAELVQTLRTLRLGVDASDLHGSLSGYLCGGGRPGEDDWLDALAIDAEGSVAAQRTLQPLYRECRAQFEHVPANLEPLLPARDAGLPRRAAALIEWCRGFLGGFGLSGAAARRALSAEAKEILADIGTIAGSNFATSDSREDEQALADVLDFVRTAAVILHRELRDAPTHSLH